MITKDFISKEDRAALERLHDVVLMLIDKGTVRASDNYPGPLRRILAICGECRGMGQCFTDALSGDFCYPADCPACNGTGERSEHKCPTCGRGE